MQDQYHTTKPNKNNNKKYHANKQYDKTKRNKTKTKQNNIYYNTTNDKMGYNSTTQQQ